jgi:2-polyprenyl-3-methyl-5-hydroxy-6-metoxy-1,4-benzoquinol methylase
MIGAGRGILDNNEQALNDEGRRLWDEKAAFWDNLHGDEGNLFHRTLVSPAVERLLALQPNERVLDIACGSGVQARRLAQLGGHVTAVDFSAELVRLAEARGQSSGEPIRYGVADATDEAALLKLGIGEYAAIVCTMALMDMPTIAPLFRAARRLLKPDGRLVIVTTHPAFNSNNPVFIAEKEDRDGVISVRRSIKITHYLQMPASLGGGAPNEPNPHYYYHRPLHQLLGEAFAAGLVLDALEEPAFPSDENLDAYRLTWATLPQIPPVLAMRLRP